jgi:hypothetical protein
MLDDDGSMVQIDLKMLQNFVNIIIITSTAVFTHYPDVALHTHHVVLALRPPVQELMSRTIKRQQTD